MNYTIKEKRESLETASLESGVSKILSNNEGKLNMEEAVTIYKHVSHLLPQKLKPYVESWLTDRVEETCQRSRGMTSMKTDRKKVSRKNPKNL
jgi:hypothetical protein